MAEVKKRGSSHTKIRNILALAEDHDTNPLTLFKAISLQERVTQLFNECEFAHNKILEICTTESAEKTQEDIFEKMEEDFIEAKSLLMKIISELQPQTTPPPQSTATQSTSTPPPSSAPINVKLPSIDLPSFNGNYADWPSFIDLFKATVDTNSHIAPSIKLQYLKSALRDEPAHLIKSLTITDSHYQEALDTLTDRYDNKREIITSLISKLLSYKTITNESASELQKLLDTVNEVVRALTVLSRPVDKWDDFLVVLVVGKLDQASRREWAIRQTTTNMASFKELKGFIMNHIRGLQATGVTGAGNNQRKFERPPGHLKTHHTSSSPSSQGCTLCKQPHLNFQCPLFSNKTAKEKSQIAKNHQLCFNCLSSTHRLKDCKSKSTCKKCQRKHHTMLHEDRSTQPSQFPAQTVPTATTQDPVNVNVNHTEVNVKTLLQTAVVDVTDSSGNKQSVRIFLDSGSEGTLITEECVQRLSLKRRRSRVQIGGVGQASAGPSSGIVHLELLPQSSSPLGVKAHILTSLTGYLPRTAMKVVNWNHISGLQLADPEWYRPAKVDVLLGMDYYYDVMCQGVRKGPDNTPTAQNTIFGWVLSGVSEVAEPHIKIHHTFGETPQQEENVENIVRRFWEIEEPPAARILTKEEKLAEAHFKQTYTRDNLGRFHVGIPFNNKKAELGTSRNMAVSRLKSVERRLQRFPEHQQQYNKFMMEYLTLGHMEPILETDLPEVSGKTFYLPHHHVINEGSSTTKLRVVFDGSAKTSTGVSLNDTMLVGATLQDDLYNLLLTFRLPPIVVKADITKMFRQFMMTPLDADYHRIVWREEPHKPIQDFRLKTVTYGTACAPNLSTRCLQQLAMDIKEKFPLAANALHNQTYVDDVMASANSVEEGKQLYRQLTDGVATAQLQLRKWSTNSPEVLACIPEEERETSAHSFENEDTLKALGVQWCPKTDNFTFKCADVSDSDSRLTKRVLLSDLSKVFDPLGFLSCVTVRAKLIMQELWKLSISWDDEVPTAVQQMWAEYQSDMKSIPLFKVPRRITIDNTASHSLHGFSDSSTIAYGCVIYLRSVDRHGNISVNFVTSKTRVAPLKQITLPRLELVSACELSILINHVKETLSLDCAVWCWSDSTITLKWIASPPRRWQTFVANRVAQIQQHTEVSWWKHVPGTSNPADLASRGVSVAEIVNNSFWLQGPSWLSESQFPAFPMNEVCSTINLEEKKEKIVIHHIAVAASILERFSSYNRLLRVTAHILRLFHNGKKSSYPRTGPLKVFEIETALIMWVRKVQQQEYGKEIQLLTQKQKLHSKSKLLQFTPYLDSSGVLRIGGRLQNSALPEQHKHQILLPSKSHLTYLIVQHYHLKNFHGGFQVTVSDIQTRFWIIHGRDEVRHQIRKCVICRKYGSKVSEQLMGNLPSVRCTPSRPFLNSGMDFAGPYTLKNPIGRAPKTYKGYICLFVCMSTKAVHLEAVSSLSTSSFIIALRRFVARRGVPAEVYSDNGTNFVGAEKEILTLLRSREHQQQLSDEMTATGIQFTFIPPSSPHKGGLWEAGVKSAKFHLKRVLGCKALTYETFQTFLCQVEAILNSRPLHPMSSDPADLAALTPGHFLIGEPLTSIPDADIRHVKTSRLDQFRQQQQLLQHFWERWSKDYLNTLQQRNKWKWSQENVNIGDLVLIKEDNSIVQSWKLARVIETFPDSEGRVRTVNLKTTTGELQRPIVKLIPLLSG